jgi:hypothetical protein
MNRRDPEVLGARWGSDNAGRERVASGPQQTGLMSGTFSALSASLRFIISVLKG